MNIESRAKAEADLPTVKPVTRANGTVFDKLSASTTPTVPTEKPLSVAPTQAETMTSKGSADSQKKSSDSAKKATEVAKISKFSEKAMQSEVSSSKGDDFTSKDPKSDHQTECGTTTMDEPSLYSAANLYKPNLRGPEMKFLIIFIIATIVTVALIAFFIYGQVTSWEFAGNTAE